MANQISFDARLAGLTARRRAIQSALRRRNLLILSVALVLVSGFSLMLVRSNEAAVSAKRSSRPLEMSPAGCSEQRYDEASGRVLSVPVRCAAADFDEEGRPVYRGTIKRLDQIGKSFRDR